MRNIIILFTFLALTLSCTNKLDKVDNGNIEFIQIYQSKRNADSLHFSISSICQDTIQNSAHFNDLLPNAKITAKVAYCIFANIYGEKTIKEELPLRLVDIGQFWFITGSIKSEKGGVAEMLIRKHDMKVVNIIHGK